jgi:hypothetical protein
MFIIPANEVKSFIEQVNLGGGISLPSLFIVVGQIVQKNLQAKLTESRIRLACFHTLSGKPY